MSIGVSRQVGQWTISGCLRDGCRLVHPVRWFIRYIVQFIRFPNITYQFHIHFRIIFSKIYSIFVLISYTHSYTHFICSFMYSFYILIHVLISYTHSCTHFIYSFMYSFHSYLVNYQNTLNKNRVREQTNYRFLFLLRYQSKARLLSLRAPSQIQILHS